MLLVACIWVADTACAGFPVLAEMCSLRVIKMLMLDCKLKRANFLAGQLVAIQINNAALFLVSG
jgi:16S rRNA G527 N7-methylase RsmG